jgi:hypothetical protein
MRTLIKLVKRYDVDDETSSMRVIKHVWMDDPFPVDTMFVADDKSYVYTGLMARGDHDGEDIVSMIYAEAEPMDVTDKLVDPPKVGGYEVNLATGEVTAIATVN